MPEKEVLRQKVRKLWILEYSLPGVLFVLSLLFNSLLFYMMLKQLFKFPAFGLLLLLLGAAGYLGFIIYKAVKAAPRGRQLSILLDERAGTKDLFSSAEEFNTDPERFGWLGKITCGLAAEELEKAQIKRRLFFGEKKRWKYLSVVTGVTLLLYTTVLFFTSSEGRLSGREVAKIKKISENGSEAAGVPKDQENKGQKTEKGPKKDNFKEAFDEFKEVKTTKPDEEMVKITNELADKLMGRVASEKEEVDLTGITPIRWDKDEVEGTNNPQNRETEEKIDPVKLDSQLLKDLEASKKEKAKDEKSGEKGGVDVAVMGGDDAGAKAKGDKGGKDDKG
ncbi:MAG: hypothetical protein WCK36_01190, partial [Candidatus Firestonebacteria bacterium]